MSNRALAGIALVVLGVVLLLSNLGLGVRFNMSSVWPLLVAMVGVMFLRDALQSGGDRSHVFRWSDHTRHRGIVFLQGG